MSYYDRWRSIKIVEQPIQPQAAPQSKPPERNLIGGLKNALEKGESIEKAKQSFLNAGYKPEEVEAAATNIARTIRQVQNNQSQVQFQSNPGQIQVQTNQNTPAQIIKNKQPKQASKGLWIVLILFSILILGGVAVAGIFWDRIAPIVGLG